MYARPFTVFADNAQIQSECDLIEVACDASLDEGHAVMRATFPSTILSGGREYFMQIADSDEAAMLIDLLSIQVLDDPSYYAEHAGMTEDDAENTARRLLERLQRVVNYQREDV